MGTMSRWGTVFAAIYDPVLGQAEKRGLSALRAEVVGQASGRTLELGAGTGLNLPHYTDAVTDLTLTEPEAPMARQLGEKLAASGRQGRILTVGAERLPVQDASVDTVVATLVLCTVRDVDASLGEVRRVLKPGGRLLFLEHVRNADPARARWQERFTPFQKLWACGCHLDRATPEAIRGAGFDVRELRDAHMPLGGPLMNPLAVGTAVRP